MLHAPTSQFKAYNTGQQERCTDVLYDMLVNSISNVRTQLVSGLHSFITSKTQHPAVDDMFLSKHMSPLIERAIVIAAIAKEPDFLQHLMERNDTCNSSLSQYAIDIVPQLLESLLDGKLTLYDFVAKATHEYIIL